MSARLLFTLKQCRRFSVSIALNHLRQEETGITVRTMIVTISSSNKSLHVNSSSSVSPFKNCKNNHSIKIWFERFSLLGFAVGREGGERPLQEGAGRTGREKTEIMAVFLLPLPSPFKCPSSQKVWAELFSGRKRFLFAFLWIQSTVCPQVRLGSLRLYI